MSWSKEDQKRWRTAHPDKVQAYRWASRAKRETLKNKPCMDCGGTFPPECMDFDHVRGEKRFGIGSILPHCSEEKLMEEIAKCDLVCSNCHRIRTRKRGHRGRTSKRDKITV